MWFLIWQPVAGHNVHKAGAGVATGYLLKRRKARIHICISDKVNLYSRCLLRTEDAEADVHETEDFVRGA